MAKHEAYRTAALLAAALPGLAAAQPQPARSQLAVGATVVPACSFTVRDDAGEGGERGTAVANCSHDAPQVTVERDAIPVRLSRETGASGGVAYVTVTY